MFTVYCIWKKLTDGRTAGWIAHVLEEYEERPLRYRARAIYTGEGDELSDPGR